MNLLTEIWIWHILPKIDDECLFNVVESDICIIDELFWKKRIEANWIVNTQTNIKYSIETYFDLINQWDIFIKPFIKCELLYAEQGCPCQSPYHICLKSTSSKPVLCMPNFIKREWVEKQEVLFFNTMRDMLNWRYH